LVIFSPFEIARTCEHEVGQDGKSISDSNMRAIARKTARNRKKFKQEKLGGAAEPKAARHERGHTKSPRLTSIICCRSVKQS
jgi:hypothetical protein